MTRGARWAWLALAVALVVSLYWGYFERQARVRAEAQLSSRYQQAFFEALGHIENVEVLLAKALVSGSSGESIRYLSELWQQAFAAQANLNALPLRQGTLMRTSQFLTQLGDFSFVAGQQVARGGSLDPSERQMLQKLYQEVIALSGELSQIVEETSSGRMPWDEMQRRSNLNLNPFSKRLDAPDQRGAFIRIEQQMQEFPTLVYDGPFSDHVTSRKPMGLGSERVDSHTAEHIALSFVGEAADRRDLVAEMIAATAEGAPIAAWRVEVRKTDGRMAPYILDVSQEGGHVLWMLRIESTDAGEATISLEEAIRRAQHFLENRGFSGFEPTYPLIESGRAVIPFVLVHDGVLVYPDQVKVTVALDSGDVVGFDGMQYFTFHHERRLGTPSLSVDNVRAHLLEELEVDAIRLALIPRPDLSEVLTYEVRARLGGLLYHIYINAQTGAEEQILRIIESESTGRLAI